MNKYKIAGPTGVDYYDTLEDAKASCRCLNSPAIIQCPDGVWLSYWSSGEETGNQQWHCARHN